MRLLGAGLLWISLTFLGVAYAHKLRNRIYILEKTAYLIKRMRVETEYLNLSAQEILFRLSDSSEFRDIDYIDNIRMLITHGEDFPVAWRQSIKRTSVNYKTDEKDKLLQLGENFGTSDIKNQISMLEMYENYFIEFISQAKMEYNKQAKTAIGVGALVGCMLFILLI